MTTETLQLALGEWKNHRHLALVAFYPARIKQPYNYFYNLSTLWAICGCYSAYEVHQRSFNALINGYSFNLYSDVSDRPTPHTKALRDVSRELSELEHYQTLPFEMPRVMADVINRTDFDGIVKILKRGESFEMTYISLLDLLGERLQMQE